MGYNNLPYSDIFPASCPCSSRDRRAGGRHGATTDPCGNVGFSPIDCGDCCIIPEPPYDPSTADMSIPKTCKNIIPDN